MPDASFGPVLIATALPYLPDTSGKNAPGHRTPVRYVD